MNNVIKILLKRKEGYAGPLPRYISPGAAGADISAHLTEEMTLGPGEWAAVPTGIALAVPFGYECQVRPRSGLALKHGVTILNSPGTIDSDYRGEIKIILINQGKEPFVVKNGDRIAQLIAAPVSRAEFQETDDLPETDRGEGGFGSSGV
ncbi:MAG: dUTP diphosphatase [Deltaproteobacteria bacterium]|nr:dUTP diphosphatase [Candidatus Zymogenaceae bacterium]